MHNNQPPQKKTKIQLSKTETSSGYISVRKEVGNLLRLLDDTRIVH